MKKWICMLLCGLVLAAFPAALSAEDETEPTYASAEMVQDDDGEPSKAVNIAGFLAIFTVSMGVTGYIVVRPKLRMLRDVRKK